MWQTLAEAYKDRDDLRLAKFDATANDLDTGEEIEDFPTIILYTKTENEEIDYRGKFWNYHITFYCPFLLGKRDYESLAKFIETREFEEYQEEESDFDDDELDISNFETEEEEKEEEDELEETKKEIHDEL